MTVKINALLAYTSKTFTFDSLTRCILQHMVNKIVIHQRNIFELENTREKALTPSLIVLSLCCTLA